LVLRGRFTSRSAPLAHELFGRYRRELAPKTFQRKSVNPGKQTAIAPFQPYFVRGGGAAGSEAAAKDKPLHFERCQSNFDIGCRESESRCKRSRASRAGALHP